jgi:hypothetical protein
MLISSYFWQKTHYPCLFFTKLPTNATGPPHPTAHRVCRSTQRLLPHTGGASTVVRQSSNTTLPCCLHDSLGLLPIEHLTATAPAR